MSFASSGFFPDGKMTIKGSKNHILAAYGGDETKLAEDFGRFADERGIFGISVLHSCAQQGFAYTVKHLVENVGMDVNIENDRGSNALHFAVQEDEVEIVAFLIEKGTNMNKLYQRGLTPLHMAARRGSKKSVQLLISKGADVHFNSKLCATPLHSAIVGAKEAGDQNQAQIDCLRLLLENGADPNAVLEGVLTPLYGAIKINSLEIMKLLLEVLIQKDPIVIRVRIERKEIRLGLTQIFAHVDSRLLGMLLQWGEVKWSNVCWKLGQILTMWMCLVLPHLRVRYTVVVLNVRRFCFLSHLVFRALLIGTLSSKWGLKNLMLRGSVQEKKWL